MPGKKLKQAQPATEETRDKLLQAAITVFSEHGYDGATVRAICHRAGVNIALVSYYYGDKMALYRAVIRYATDADAKMALLSRAVKENPDPKEALRQLIRGLLERFITRKTQSGLSFRLMLNELTSPTAALADEIETTMRPLYDQFRAAVGRVLQLPPDDMTTRLCAHSIIGQITHYVHARPALTSLWPEMQFTPDQVGKIATHIADFSLAYRAPAKTQTKARRAKKPQRKSR